jgi:hypothetical protein
VRWHLRDHARVMQAMRPSHQRDHH